MRSSPPSKAVTKKVRFEKAVRELDGIIQGITADGIVNDREVESLKAWMAGHEELSESQPLKDAYTILARILADNVVDPSELEELKNFSDLMHRQYSNVVTADLQSVFGFLSGVMADRVLNETERKRLIAWMDDRSHLKGYWPYDEIFSVAITSKIPENLQQILNQFSSVSGELTVNLELLSTVSSICTTDPEITVADRTFCFTGESSQRTRKELAAFVDKHGGQVSDSVTKKTDFLVVCADGSQNWAFTTFGRKIQRAFEMRKSGHTIQLVQEFDFLDHLRDLGSET
jgi:NAD-dependent DNA ligase